LRDVVLYLCKCVKCHETCDDLLVMCMLGNCVDESLSLG